MRHAAFRVNPTAKEHWLAHMRSALDSLELSPMDDGELWDYLQRAALSMVNTFEA
jgi:hemoglobin